MTSAAPRADARGAGVALLLVGDELVEGRAQDGNGAWLARRLADEGAHLARWAVVGDAPVAIAAALHEAAAVAALVVVSGGLGPTEDDRTRAGLALAAGVDLVEDPQAWAWIEGVFRRRGREPQPVQRRQALVPRGARWLENPVGTAPGLDVRVGEARVLAFPGVPEEFQALVHGQVVPRVRDLPGRVPTALRLVATAGLPETEVADRLGDLVGRPDLVVGWYPHQGEVEVSLRTSGTGCEERADGALASARERLGEAVLDVAPGERIEHAVVRLLLARGLRLATAESVTGGLLARLLTGVPGASAVYPAGFVTYSDEAKVRDLGVPEALLARHGAVSAEVAGAMAEGALRRAGVDVAVATTGVAGPGDLEVTGSPPVPQGTVFVAFTLGGPARSSRLRLPLPRALVQRRAAVEALDRLRRGLTSGAGGR